MTRAGKREFSSKSLLAGLAVVEDAEVVNCDLLAFLNVSQRIDGVPFDVLVPAFLGIIVVGIVNTACIEENTYFHYIVPKGESVRSDDSKVPRGSVVRVMLCIKRKARRWSGVSALTCLRMMLEGSGCEAQLYAL